MGFSEIAGNLLGACRPKCIACARRFLHTQNWSIAGVLSLSNVENSGRHSAVVYTEFHVCPKPKTLNEELSPGVYAARASADVCLGDYEQASSGSVMDRCRQPQ